MKLILAYEHALCFMALLTQIIVLFVGHSLIICLRVLYTYLYSAVCGLRNDKQISEGVKESDDLYESGL
jgi:hypothetical protein